MTRFEREFNKTRQDQIFRLLQARASDISFQEVLDLLKEDPNLSAADFHRFFFKGQVTTRLSVPEFRKEIIRVVQEKPQTIAEIMKTVGDGRIRLSYYNHLRALRAEGWLRLDGRGMNAKYVFIEDKELRDAA